MDDAADQPSTEPVQSDTSQGAAGNPRKAQHQQKAALLFALRQVFEINGFDGATLNQLAAATGLGKASLYHHFPGGKEEMAAVLLRNSVAELERLAFSKLSSTRPPAERLRQFIDGFREYTRDGEGSCLVLVLSEGSAAARHGKIIARQYGDWIRRIAAIYVETGLKQKKADRRAVDLLAGLYGHLVTSRIEGDPQQFRGYIKRLKKLPLP